MASHAARYPGAVTTVYPSRRKRISIICRRLGSSSTIRSFSGGGTIDGISAAQAITATRRSRPRPRCLSRRGRHFRLQASPFALNFESVVLRTLASSSAWLAAGALVALSSLASGLGGCTGSVEDRPGVGGGGGSGGTGGTGGASAAGPTLDFTMPEPLMLPRRETQELEVQAWPPGMYVVRFAL